MISIEMNSSTTAFSNLFLDQSGLHFLDQQSETLERAPLLKRGTTATNTNSNNSSITGNSSTSSSDSDNFNHNNQQQREESCPYSPYKSSSSASSSSSCTESRIKDLIESPILNKGLSPRLSQIMRSHHSQPDSSFKSTELFELNSPEKCRSLNDCPGYKQQESIECNGENNGDNVILDTSPPQPPPPPSSSSSLPSPKPSKSVDYYVSSSPRALAIFKAASKSSTTNSGRKYVPVVQTNSSDSSGSDSDSTSSGLSKASHPPVSTSSNLKRSLSFQDYFSIRRPLKFPSANTRGSALLKAAQQSKSPIHKPILPVEQIKKSAIDDVKTTIGESPKNGILRKDGSPSLSKQKRKVIFTEPVVSRQMYFDSTICTLPTAQPSDVLTNAQLDTKTTDIESMDISYKKQKLNDDTPVVIIKRINSNKTELLSAVDEEEEGDEEYKLRIRKVSKNYVNLFLSDFEDTNNCDNEPLTVCSEHKQVNVQNCSSIEIESFSDSLLNQSTISDSEGNSSLMLDMNLDVSPILPSKPTINNDDEDNLKVESMDIESQESAVSALDDCDLETKSCESIEKNIDSQDSDFQVEKSSQISNDDSIQSIEESPIKKSNTTFTVEQKQMSVSDVVQENVNPTSNELDDETVPISKESKIVSLSSQVLASPRALSIFKAATRLRNSSIFSMEYSPKTLVKSTKKQTNSSVSNNRGAALVQAAKTKILQSTQELINADSKIEVISTDSYSETPKKSILRIFSPGSSNKKVVFREPVVSREVCFDSSNTKLVICGSSNEQNVVDEEDDDEDEVTTTEQPAPQIDLKTSTNVDEESENNDTDDDSVDDSKPKNYRRKKLCHQNSTYEDCDNFVINRSKTNVNDGSDKKIALNKISITNNSTLDESFGQDLTDEEEPVYFSKSYGNFMFEESVDKVAVVEENKNSEINIEDVESISEINTENVKSESKEAVVQEISTIEEISTECKPSQSQSSESGSLSSDELYQQSVYTQKFTKTQHQIVDEQDTDTVIEMSSIESESIESVPNTNNKDAVVFKENSTQTTTNNVENDCEMVLVPMPLKLAKQFYFYLNSFFKANNVSMDC